MNLAGHRDPRLSENYFEPCFCKQSQALIRRRRIFRFVNTSHSPQQKGGLKDC